MNDLNFVFEMQQKVGWFIGPGFSVRASQLPVLGFSEQG